MSEPRMTHEQAIDVAPGYVLGALERDDEAAVRDHLATCLLPHPDFEALGGIVPALLDLDDLVLVEPPPSLGLRIMAAAAADLAANPRGAASSPATTPGPITPASDPATASPPATAPIAFPTAAERVIREDVRRSRASRFDWALRIAAVIAIVASGAYGLNVRGQLDAAQRFDRAIASVVQAAGQPGALTVALGSAKDSKASGIAAVGSDGAVVMAIRDLPATTGSQVYEAWVIVGKTAPLAVGGFTVDNNGSALFTTRPATTPPGAVIALTLEPRAGNTAPEGPVVAVGAASAPPPASS